MSKVSLKNLTTNYVSVSSLNENFQTIQDALNDAVLFRDNPDVASPNYMENNLDMNSFRILNLPTPLQDHEAATFGQIRNFLTQVQEALATANEANIGHTIYVQEDDPSVAHAAESEKPFLWIETDSGGDVVTFWVEAG